MLEALGAAAGDTGFGIVGNLVGAGIQHQYWKKQYGIQRKDYLADREHMEQYNSPENQMQLLAQAGLNPNLVYGKYQGAASSGTSSPQQNSPKGVSPTHSTTNIAGNMASLANARLTESQADSLTARAELDRAQANRLNSLLPNDIRLQENAIEESNARIEKIYNEIINMGSEHLKNLAQINLFNSQAILNDADTRYRNGEISLQEYRQQEIIACTAMYTSQSRLFNAQANLASVNADVQKLQAEINHIISSAGGAEKLAQAHIDKIGHELAILAGKAGVEQNSVYQWVNHLMPILEPISKESRNWYNAVQHNKNVKNGKSSALSDEQIAQIVQIVLKTM